MNGARPSYVVVGNKPWNREVFRQQIQRLPGRWHYCGVPSRLEATLRRVRPRYAFFIHWSHKVPDALVNEFECVCFHMTDVPFGRGGTPLQNLIVRGFTRTRLTALRMTAQFDAGPVYLKRSLSLAGRAEDIYRRMTHTAADMIRLIIRREPAPRPQRGRATVFLRRGPAESEIPRLSSLTKLYDFIRMLDAPGYPYAFLTHEGYRYEFSRAEPRGPDLLAQVRITATKETRR